MAKILYIGENNLIITSLVKELTGKGYDVVTFQDPSHALAELFKTKYDCIFTNVLNKQMDGISLFVMIKNSNTINSVTPFILLTSEKNLENQFSADKKPFRILQKNENLTNNLIEALKEIQAPNKKTIDLLYIEDDPFIQKLVKIWLNKINYINLRMISSLEQLKQLNDRSYDIIVTDNLLTDGNAKDVIHLIQRSTVLKNTPILIYTGTVEKLSLHELQKMGKVIDILPKPFEMNTFISKIEMIQKLKA